MLGRMAMSGDHKPAVTADDDLVAGEEALVRPRPLRHAARVGVAPRGDRGQMLGREPMGTEELAGCIDTVTGPVVGDRVSGQILGLGHCHRALPAARQPGGVAEVVGVIVGGDDAMQNAAPEGSDEMLFP